MAKFYRCKQPFAFRMGVRRRVVTAGLVVSDADPDFKDRQAKLTDPAYFEPLDEYVERTSPTVEQATADPDEKRTVTRARKPRAGKPAGPGVNTTKSAPGADGKEGAK